MIVLGLVVVFTYESYSFREPSACVEPLPDRRMCLCISLATTIFHPRNVTFESWPFTTRQTLRRKTVWSFSTLTAIKHLRTEETGPSVVNTYLVCGGTIVNLELIWLLLYVALHLRSILIPNDLSRLFCRVGTCSSVTLRYSQPQPADITFFILFNSHYEVLSFATTRGHVFERPSFSVASTLRSQPLYVEGFPFHPILLRDLALWQPQPPFSRYPFPFPTSRLSV